MDKLTLPVTLNGEELQLPVKMYPYGYTFRVEVTVGQSVIIFEPDEKGSYRALVNAEQLGKDKVLTHALLAAIAGQLEKLR